MPRASTPLSPVLTQLATAVARLNDGQGNVARRNARAAVTKEVRRLDTLVDRYFPPPPRRQKVRKTKAAITRGKVKAYRAAVNDGWELWGSLSNDRKLYLSRIGFKARMFGAPVTNTRQGYRLVTMVPWWAAKAPLNQLSKFKRSVSARKAWESAQMMGAK